MIKKELEKKFVKFANTPFSGAPLDFEAICELDQFSTDVYVQIKNYLENDSYTCHSSLENYFDGKEFFEILEQYQKENKPRDKSDEEAYQKMIAYVDELKKLNDLFNKAVKEEK